eukprot:GHRQ01019252.1.p1 GENE.GHRQ01019252.1~~GHRQ01019252.1.p1  ORF type:complete len:207 (-),score=40.09 GHRQ01019252.1:65-685(-)
MASAWFHLRIPNFACSWVLTGAYLVFLQVPTELTELEASADVAETEKPVVALGLHRTASHRKPSTTGSFTGPRSGQHRPIRTPAARRQASLRVASTLMAATASSEGGDDPHQQHGHHGLHLPGLHRHHSGSRSNQHSDHNAKDAGVVAVISPRAAAQVHAFSVVGAPINGTGGNTEGGVKPHEAKAVEGTSSADWPVTGNLGIHDD